jgi:SAM-dependent methyltransferase
MGRAVTRSAEELERRLAAVFRCPSCGDPLEIERGAGPLLRCESCGWLSEGRGGVLDFANDPARAEERAFYEDEWTRMSASVDSGSDISELARIWRHPAKPVYRSLIQHLGDLRGKRVLLIGNGGSAAELYFLTLDPELLIFSDLTCAGVATVRDAYPLDGYAESVCFCAIDALDLPLADASVDVVYGNVVVHHLPDRGRFLGETVRVLRPGGHAVFSDSAYSSLWQFAKRTVLRPLFAYSHRRLPRSPEDVRETMQGGFREAELAKQIRGLGADPWFERQGLTYYLWRRASLVLFPDRLEHLGEHPVVSRALISLDERLMRYRFAREQSMRLIWGLRKPESAPRL